MPLNFLNTDTGNGIIWTDALDCCEHQPGDFGRVMVIKYPKLDSKLESWVCMNKSNLLKKKTKQTKATKPFFAQLGQFRNSCDFDYVVFFLTTSYNPGFFSSFVVITEVTSPTIGKCLLMRSSKRACLSSGRVLTRKNERELQITTTLLPIGFRIAGPYKKLGFCEKNSNIFQHFPPQLCFSLCFWHYCFATHENL